MAFSWKIIHVNLEVVCLNDGLRLQVMQREEYLSMENELLKNNLREHHVFLSLNVVLNWQQYHTVKDLPSFKVQAVIPALTNWQSHHLQAKAEDQKMLSLSASHGSFKQINVFTCCKNICFQAREKEVYIFSHELMRNSVNADLMLLLVRSIFYIQTTSCSGQYASCLHRKTHAHREKLVTW